MNEGVTLDDLAAPLRALRLLTADFGHLSAPAVRVTPIYPERLELAFHDDLAGFEGWRDALGIAPDAVTHGTQSDGRTRVLKASIDYAGAAVDLVGYGDVPAPALTGAAA
ncbi:hypothetical protein RKE30_03595 [Streptomyces sp. Li-HN-5-11]|uniref:hypothetical protein n=1 Tax=Streptomyces sp. Li-HN-5-11 TaxID=3075432 RepID=UPI0028A923B3|nr:hypothetical protein [Streptomyces sp. Li-HN-5-11]WNM29541.1 hypothetical protein RKE30_03595 [Streptomyces sp. Li-HN-5-11]